jgi:dTDP-4-dehydrorhamnose 3,5-epimerase
MKITKRKLVGTYEIDLCPRIDERGFFMRTFDLNIFSENDINRNWVQENHSKSEKKGVLRGLHFQLPPFSETKLVRCINGGIYDVFVDLRKNSSTFGQWDSIELTAENRKMIYIPRGFAHGFCTLTHVSEVIYKVDNYYSPSHEMGLIWNDPRIGIRWPISMDPFLSDKDKLNLSFEEFVNKTGNIILD